MGAEAGVAIPERGINPPLRRSPAGVPGFNIVLGLAGVRMDLKGTQTAAPTRHAWARGDTAPCIPSNCWREKGPLVC